MIIMAVDYGDTRTGIAVSDALEMMAFPKNVIKGYTPEKVADSVITEATNCKAELLVIGNPKNMDGSEGFRSQKTKELVEILKTKTDLNIVLWDERLSTVSAHNSFNEVNIRGKKRKENIDAQAAVVILQSFLDSRSNRG